MKTMLAIAFWFLATSAVAAPVNNAKMAVKIACAAMQNHLAGGSGSCADLTAVLRGDVWTVSQKWVPQDQVGGGASVVEVSQETGEVLDFYLAN